MTGVSTYWDGQQWLGWDGQQWLSWNGQQWVAATANAAGVPEPNQVPAAPPAPQPGPAAYESGPPVGPPPGPTAPPSGPPPGPTPVTTVVTAAAMPPAPLPGPVAATPTPPAKSSRTVALVLGAVAVLLVAGVGAYLLGTRSASTPAGSGATPSASATPNGIESKSTEDILSTARTAALAQTSVTLHTVQESSGGSSLELTLAKGAGGYGTITDDKGTLQLVATTSTMYIKAEGSVWQERLGAAASAAIGDKWLAEPNTDEGSFAQIAEVLDFDTAVGDLLTSGTTVTKGQVSQVDGVPAVPLDSSDGRLWIATTGEPLPLRIEATGTEKGMATFTGWSAPVTIPVPAPDQVISIDEVKKLVP